jgi:RNA polymerase sigma factor (sigma-70 family)
VQRGQHELFYELVRPYESRVYAAALAILRNEQDAEDAAQEAMLKAFANIRQFSAEARFSTWLIQITVNEALMRRRRERTVVMEGIDDRRDEKKANTRPGILPTGARFRRKRWNARRCACGWRRLWHARPKVSRSFCAARYGASEHSGDSGGTGYYGGFGENAAVAGAADVARSAGRRMGAGLVQPAAIREGDQAMVGHEN